MTEQEWYTSEELFPLIRYVTPSPRKLFLFLYELYRQSIWSNIGQELQEIVQVTLNYVEGVDKDFSHFRQVIHNSILNDRLLVPQVYLRDAVYWIVSVAVNNHPDATWYATREIAAYQNSVIASMFNLRLPIVRDENLPRMLRWEIAEREKRFATLFRHFVKPTFLS